MHRLPGTTPSPATSGIEEEEIRMEIKALKGLVLNRSVSLSPSHSPFAVIGFDCSHADIAICCLQQNVHSGCCSERADGQGPVTRRLDVSQF